ncbi:uncharacterized protein Dwil_GK16131 [Drosophila willistoni]|uniref:Putative ionotropic receptor ligand binding domain-containing protein n=2 Tax=Drosophila willistoni TaxID=7260 RepID=B4N2F0_DROWI|nr:uncharacterized protein Dwil_GK16131 [Drosophila willistoni]
MDLFTECLARSVVYLANNFIATQINTLVIRQSCLNCSYPLYERQRKLIDYVLQHSGPKLAVHITNRKPQVQEISHYTLFVVNNVEAFRKQNWSVPDRVTEHYYHFLIVVSARFQEIGFEYIVRELILASFHVHVPNVIVVIQRTEPQDIRIYAHTFFDADCKPGVQIYEYNRFNASGRLMKSILQLFPPLSFTGNNCTVRVSAHQVPPYFMLKNRKKAMTEKGILLEGSEARGIDAELLLLLAKAMRFRIQLLMPNESTQLYGEANVSGCLAQLAAGKADMAIGSLSGSDKRRNFFSISAVYHQCYFVFVLRSQLASNRYNHLLLPFRRKIWYATGILLLSLLLFIGILRRQILLNYPLESLLVSCFGCPVATQRLATSFWGRYIFVNWLLLTLVLRCAYQAKLFDVLRAPHYIVLPECLQEMIEQNYTLVSSSYHDFYPEYITYRMNSTFQERYRYLENAALGKRLATISLLNNLAYWNRKHRNNSSLTYMREPIYLYQLAIYFPKLSLYKYAIDRKINQLLSSGVMGHIERRYLSVNYIDMRESHHLPKITNDIFVGVYKVIVALFILSMLLFILERLSMKWQGLRQIIEWMQ